MPTLNEHGLADVSGYGWVEVGVMGSMWESSRGLEEFCELELMGIFLLAYPTGHPLSL